MNFSLVHDVLAMQVAEAVANVRKDLSQQWDSDTALLGNPGVQAACMRSMEMRRTEIFPSVASSREAGQYQHRELIEDLSSFQNFRTWHTHSPHTHLIIRGRAMMSLNRSAPVSPSTVTWMIHPRHLRTFSWSQLRAGNRKRRQRTFSRDIAREMKHVPQRGGCGGTEHTSGG